MKEKDFEKLIESMHTIMELRKSIQENYDDEEDDDDHRDNEFQDKLNMYQKEYEEILKWALGKPSVEMRKDRVVKKWHEIHPDLPELFLPPKVDHEMSNLLFLMQVIPLWHDFKKTHKKGS